MEQLFKISSNLLCQLINLLDYITETIYEVLFFPSWFHKTIKTPQDVANTFNFNSGWDFKIATPSIVGLAMTLQVRLIPDWSGTEVK
jgi:hypothetical protein